MRQIIKEIEKKYVKMEGIEQKKYKTGETDTVIRSVTVDHAAASIHEPTLQNMIKKITEYCNIRMVNCSYIIMKTLC